MDKVLLLKLMSKLPDNISSKLIHRYVKSSIKKYANIKINGYEKIRDLEGPIIFICNHLSNSDGIILNEVLKEKDPVFIAGVKLTANEFTRNGFKFVKTIQIKPNSADKEAISKIIEVLKAGKNIMMFPEGTRSRTGAMIEGKKGLLLIAKMSKATIVPIGMCGTEKFLPINDEDMAEENFNYADITINFGEPMTVPKKLEDEDKNQYSDRAMTEIMCGIAKMLPEKYRGVYSEFIKM
ncbi:lysophospholipid acyltransferase family protein [Clostridium sp. UBA4548]|uniref:lysophospholipid acyltransferase family protein n=1 Tax=Clostridium sp. UBA4548 TaxID=1946361 RepID=UPI0025C37173|nr:lysophospholipid acyltransferase family protein [Clostridium sp. UBA4548]